MYADTLEQSQAQYSERQPASILIVDDDENQVEVLAYRLQSQGFMTLEANNGQKALSLAHEERPHLILLDLRLPDMSGFDLCEKLADDPATCGIPVIVLSGMERPDIVRRARSAGCQFYVRKPYDPNALLILIQKAIQDALET